MKKASKDKDIQGVAAARNGPKITHLFFADDSLLFCKAQKKDCQHIMSILQLYEKVSGQKINMEKSAIYFSSNTKSEDRGMLRQLLKVQAALEEDRYLGIPIMIGRDKNRELRSIKERVKAKIQGWSAKILSQAGKAVLIQAVAQSIPIYIMSCFLLPKGFINEVNMIMSRFWWGDSSRKNKIHWKAWDSLCVSKMDGGLGFRDFESFNLALLAKQWWRLVHNEDSLGYRVFKAKYFPFHNPSEAVISPKASIIWRSLMKGREVVNSGAVWRVGNGKSINVWNDKWIPHQPSRVPSLLELQILTPIQVCRLIDAEGRKWDEHMIYEMFKKKEDVRIMVIPLSKVVVLDKLIWERSMTG